MTGWHGRWHPPASRSRCFVTCLLASHTSAEDCGRIAQAAGVKTLVLSHLVPVDDPNVTDQVWIDLVRPRFKGNVIVAKDLMEI